MSLHSYQRHHHLRYVLLSYNDCHNKDGSLNIIETMEDGSKRSQLGKYMEFQCAVARDCARIYRDFKAYFGNPQNVSKKTFTAQNIVDSFRRDEMIDKVRELRKIDLYLSLLEVDKQKFKTKDQDVMKLISTHIKNLTSYQKTMTENTEVEKNTKKQLLTQIEDMKFAQEFMKEVLKECFAAHRA